MTADTHHFLLSPSVRLIPTSSLQWPAAIFSTKCFLSVMTKDKRGLNIRSISMDFRFKSPGEHWALWKDSERATKGTTSKHQRKKKNQSRMIYGPKVMSFFQDTHKTTCVKANIGICHCSIISVCKLWHKVKISFLPPLLPLNTQSDFVHHSTISFFNLEEFFTFGLLLI